MHDQLFANFTALENQDLLLHSQVLGLDLPKFQQCIESGKYANEVRKDISDGQKAGVRGTPTFFIGISEQEASKIKILKLIRGAQPYPVFKEALETILK